MLGEEWPVKSPIVRSVTYNKLQQIGFYSIGRGDSSLVSKCTSTATCFSSNYFFCLLCSRLFSFGYSSFTSWSPTTPSTTFYQDFLFCLFPPVFFCSKKNNIAAVKKEDKWKLFYSPFTLPILKPKENLNLKDIKLITSQSKETTWEPIPPIIRVFSYNFNHSIMLRCSEKYYLVLS